MARGGSTTVLRVEIAGDAAGATRAFRQMASEAQKAGTVTTQQARSMTRALDEVDRKAKGLNLAKLSDAGRSTAVGRLGGLAGGGPGGDLLSGLGGAEAVLAGVSTGAIAATAGVAALGVAAVAAGKVSVGAFTSMAASVQQFAFLTGKSAEEASGFALALEAVGLGTDQWVDRVRQFQTNLAQFPARAREFNLEIERNADGTVDASETMLNALQMLHDEPDVLARQRKGFMLFGESWTQLQAIIRDPQGFAELRKQFEGTFSQAQLDKARQFDVSMKTLQMQAKIAAAELGAELVPALTGIAEAAADVLPAVGMLASALGKVAAVTFGPVVTGLRAIGEAAGFAEGSVGTVGAALGNVGDQVHSGTARAVALTEEEFDKLHAKTLATAAAAKTLQGQYRSSASSMIDASQARSVAAEGMAAAEVSAAQTVADANAAAAASIAAAQAQVSSAYQAAGEAANDLTKAEIDAARTVADAEKAAAKSIIDAQKRLGDAHKDRERAVGDLAKAEVDAARTIADANEEASKRVVDAQRRVADARERASRTQRDNARKLQDAEEAVRDALTAALADDNPITAARRREEAQQSYQRVREDVAESELDAAKNVGEAEQGLRDATVEAEQRRSDAAERAAETIASARERVAEADERVREANLNLAETAAEAEQRKVDAANSAAESIAGARSRVASASAAVAQAEWNLANTAAQAEAARERAAVQAANTIAAARHAEILAAMALEEAQNRLRHQMMQLIRLNMIAGNPTAYGQAAANIAMGKPQFQSGGVYHAPPGRSGGLAMLHDKETVFTPEQLGVLGHAVGSGGGGVIININAPVYGDRRALIDEIRRAVRDGYRP